MLGAVLLVATGIILCFGLVVAVGAPYVPTMRPQVEAAFELLQLEPGQTLLELGCGDGKVLLAAARRGVQAVGYELNPLLYALCVVRTWRYRKLVTVKYGDFWSADWPKADAIFGFILPRLMHKLDEKLIREQRTPVKVASFAFKIPVKEVTAEKHGVFLYEYH